MVQRHYKISWYLGSMFSLVEWSSTSFMAFFGFFSSYLLRQGLSVAIVAMVNQTAVANEQIVVTNVTEEQCPRDPELQYEDGEFTWNRNQQGIVLAAFYYGYTFTQVYIRNISGSRSPYTASSFLNIC